MHALVAFAVRQWDLWPAVAVDRKNDKLFLPPPYPVWPRPGVSDCLGVLMSKQQEGGGGGGGGLQERGEGRSWRKERQIDRESR